MTCCRPTWPARRAQTPSPSWRSSSDWTPDRTHTVRALRNPLPELPIALRLTLEKEMLGTKKELLWWRGILTGFAIFLTLLRLSFQFASGQITWTVLHEAPPRLTAVVCLGAASVLGWFSLCETPTPGQGSLNDVRRHRPSDYSESASSFRHTRLPKAQQADLSPYSNPGRAIVCVSILIGRRTLSRP
jgi:hypothetical protein